MAWACQASPGPARGYGWPGNRDLASLPRTRLRVQLLAPGPAGLAGPSSPKVLRGGTLVPATAAVAAMD